MDRISSARETMIRDHLKARGIRDPAVLRAMEEVPREEFVPEELVEFAYGDYPLAIGEGQTISQPYIVALMAELLELGPEDRVLEIGTGSGYSAAILGRIAREVFTVEHYATLAQGAASRLRRLNCGNVTVLLGDGTRGWQEFAPYQAIQVTAGAPHVPKALREQLATGGRLVIPVGHHPRMQSLERILRIGENEFRREDMCAVQFVPLIGEDGWGDDL
ncbi:protein-L-isoaspartate(D-aspartate) O-methyltransferase [Geobacter sp. DSM 9736]|uniref:protein-L-isoaspartate(D-aspartate) O-methyltransferase n=1 Tax=Geobacter sp. DSM 9736 TaxID=1277350 RepID=UPI000B5115DD|nr:protein-L-isoaspartate(D-aspartate) O-methyltransferase [Geobacter sp. DSM 9736]SNB44729.1 protein-L-isoaspartate(D-aspartate) O-methyltransferase [Geobacter sp. DSM 9736]